MKTYTPALDPAALDRLRGYAALFTADFPQAKPARWAGVYLHGLLTDGDRKSIEPLSRRVTLPDGLASTTPSRPSSSSSARARGTTRPSSAATGLTWQRPSPARTPSS